MGYCAIFRLPVLVPTQQEQMPNLNVIYVSSYAEVLIHYENIVFYCTHTTINLWLTFAFLTEFRNCKCVPISWTSFCSEMKTMHLMIREPSYHANQIWRLIGIKCRSTYIRHYQQEQRSIQSKAFLSGWLWLLTILISFSLIGRRFPKLLTAGNTSRGEDSIQSDNISFWSSVSQWRQMVPDILVSIDSGNDLSPIYHQAITWTNADLLLIWPFETNLGEN